MANILAQYRLNSLSELNKYLIAPEQENFMKAVNSIYRLLAGLRPGEVLIVEKDISPENREIFIKIGCLYIYEGNTDYQYTEDYSIIRRLHVKPETEVQKILKQFTLKKEKNELERSKRTNTDNAPRENRSERDS